MRCFIRQVGKNWHAAFDWAGVSYTHSLRTKDEREAERRIGPIRDVLYRLENGTLAMPPGADHKAFIVSGGKVEARPKPIERLSLGDLKDLYLAARTGVEANTRSTLAIHLGHFVRILGESTPVDSVRLADVQGYARARSGQQHHGRPISGYTIRKELRTFHKACSWAFGEGRASSPPAWESAAVDLAKDKGREPFRTLEDIERIIARGGVSPAEQDRLWETLYLSWSEVEALLDYVRGHAAPWIYAMFSFVALTGCRRSEMVRSRLDDWDLARRIVLVREKKRDTSIEYTTRQIDLHPRLVETMSEWFAAHPGGQNAITQDGGPLTVDQATDHFKRTLRGHSKWSKVPGFHTFRHSLASILASNGTDQRYVDAILGHTTEDMRKRYQHLFPRGARDAIRNLS